MPESLIPAKKMVPIPRLNEDEPKYSGGFKLRIAQMRKYYTTRFAGGQFFSESPRALIPCLRIVFHSKIRTHSTSERGQTKIFRRVYNKLSKYGNITQLGSPGVNVFLSPPEHSFHAYKTYSAQKILLIPLLNDNEPKYFKGLN